MKKVFYFLLLCVAGVLSSCSEDEGISKHEDVHEKSYNGYKRSIVDFQKMKSALSLSNGQALSLFSNLSNKGGDDYIQTIDSTHIIQYSNDTLTTYTMGVSTLDDENYSYSNLIIRLMDGETEEFIAHYSPTDEWQQAHNNGELLPYEGTLHVTDTEGISILNNEENTQGKPASECYFSLESEHVECYGSTCPCTDGNGTTNYRIVLVCSGSTGGGSGDGDGPPNGNGGGGSGSGGSGGSGSGGEDPGLPTDPNEWDLFILGNELDDFLGDFDYYELGNFSSNPPLMFDSYDEFRYFVDGPYSVEKSIHSDQNNERVLKYRVNRTGLAGIDIFPKLILTNGIYSLIDVTSNKWGLSLAYDWDQSHYTQNTANNVITVVVEGYEIIGVQINGIDFTYNNYKSYTIRINKITGLLL